MYRLKNRLRLISVLIATLTFLVAPCLQAYQSNCASDDPPESCCGGCSCGPAEAPFSEAPLVDSSCCCSVSAPATRTEVPLEAQLGSTAKSVTFAVVASAVAHITVVETERYQTARINQQSAHGPPLYVLNASYLI